MDLISRLRADWLAESPQLDTSAMEVVGRVVMLANLWQAQADKLLAEFNLTYSEFDIVATLRRSGKPYKMTPTELQKSVLLTSGAMTAALRRLQRKGFIARSADPNDGRAKLAYLTKTGIAVSSNTAALRFELAQNQIESLSFERRGTLSELLKGLLR